MKLIGSEERMLGGIGLLIERLESAWLPAFIPPFPDMHTYEPLRVDQFIEAMCVAGQHANGRRYLEVGCGIGSKLLVAASMGYEATGIDNRRQYLVVAEWLARHQAQREPVPVELESVPEIRLEQADARYYDHRHFDVIYAYRIMVENGGQAAYEAYLTDTVQSGTVLIMPVAEWDNTAWTPTAHRWVWVR